MLAVNRQGLCKMGKITLEVVDGICWKYQLTDFGDTKYQINNQPTLGRSLQTHIHSTHFCLWEDHSFIRD